MKRYLKDLNRDELRKVYDNNRHFREKAFEWACDTASRWVEEYLEELAPSAASYEFGMYTHCFFKIKEPEDVFTWLDKVQKDYCLLSDDDFEMVKEADALHQKYWYSGATTDEEDERLFDELIPAIEKAVCCVLASEYSWFETDENLFEYAYENLEQMFSEGAYILQGGADWAIYEVVEYRYV